MKKLVLFLFIAVAVNAKSVPYWDKVFQNLSVQERSAIVTSFVKGMKHDLSYSLAAIHLKESFGSRYKYNINTGTSIDVGAFMINTAEYNRKMKRVNSKWNTARAMEELADYNINLNEAITILKYCHKAAKGDWRKTYRYYNGWKSGSKASYNYSVDIVNIIRMLETYFNNPAIKNQDIKD